MTTGNDPAPDNYAAPERFAVSNLGMRQIHAGRPPWMLMKELVQNVWDEAPETTICRVDIRPANTGEHLLSVRVEDDGPGFADIADAWTLMKHTPNHENPSKRSRFSNLGEKGLVSVAAEAKIETAGHTVYFLRIGWRTVTYNDRQRGTVITAQMPWPMIQAEELISLMKRFRPNGCNLEVNGELVPEREPELVITATLDTVIYDRNTGIVDTMPRQTEIHLLPQVDEETWLYEMGIPIQKIQHHCDIDVQQKIPMQPNQDTVLESYLADIYAEVLNATHTKMETNQFSEQWVKTAMKSPRVDSAAVKSVVKGRYGNQVLLELPRDKESNLRAVKEGYRLVDPSTLSPKEKERFQKDAGLKTARAIFRRRKAQSAPVPPEQLPQYEGFAAWAKSQAALCELDATIEFIESPGASTVADCTSMSKSPVIRFNTAHSRLPAAFFRPPFGREEQLELLIHELGHALAKKPGHGPAWGDGTAKAGAMIAAAGNGKAGGNN